MNPVIHHFYSYVHIFPSLFILMYPHLRYRATLPSLPFLNNEYRNLAPKKPIDADIDGQECPICFLNFEALNIATCCSQTICTDCYMLVKNAVKGSPICPFCSLKSMSVRYTPLANDTPLTSPKQGGISILPSAVSPAKGGFTGTPSSSSGSKKVDYDTPQPKPRSRDNTPTSAVTSSGSSSASKKTPVYVPLASVTDRKQVYK